ncbi:hypothetical protein Bca52824_037802 [Brassica carinata]|uniref:Zinc knuckle CX2CX4HX4C domain-containing protein n=1 Tax=Brassica carinata TaxID=52824 RepID=A0A8X7RNI2_BRACI|nr:hypothetical protein Bca52824_037802 [Brassica carinata]
MCGLDRWIADVIRSESSDLDVQNQILGGLFLDESLPSSSVSFVSSKSCSEDEEGGEGYNGQHVYKPPSLKENRSGALNTTKHLWVCCHGFKGFGLSRTCIAPLERMKLEYIVRGEQRSLLGLIQRIATTEGIRGFRKGNLVNILRTAPFKSINFYAYDTYRGQLLRLSGNEETTNFERFVAGAAAGVTASLLCLPLDTIRTVMVALGGEALGGVVDAFRHMIQTEGYTVYLYTTGRGHCKTIDKELGNCVVKDAKEAKIWVEVNGLQPLIMKMEIELPTEDVTEVEFEYIKIEKYCFTCFSLFHEESDCPQRPQNALPPKERKLGITQMIALQRIEAEKKRHDDRRGYIRPEVFRTSTRQSEDSYAQNRGYRTSDRGYYTRREDHRRDQSILSRTNRTNSDYYRNNAPSQQYRVLERNGPNSGSFAHQKLLVNPSANSDIRGTILPVTERNLPSNPRDEVTPTRSLKDHLGIPLNGNEGTTSGSKEQRSALAHLTDPIPNEEQPARRTLSFESGRLQKAVIRTEEVEMVNQEIIEESSPLAGRIPATLRLGVGSWRTIKRGVIPFAPQRNQALHEHPQQPGESW